MIGIYKITNPKGKVYVGQAVNIKRRWLAYKRIDCKCQVKLYNSLKKYGPEKHKFEIICECKVDELNELERYYQEIYSAIGKGGLNCVLVKTENLKSVFSDEHRQRMSAKLKGRKLSDETRKNMSLSRKREWEEGKRVFKKILVKPVPRYGKDNPGYGKKMSLEAREKMRLKKLGGKWSEESIKKRTKSQTGLKRSEETKKRISESLIGRTLSSESRKKMSIKKSSPLLNLENGIFYDNIIKAAEAHEFVASTLARRLNGQTKKKSSFVLI